MAVSNQKGQSYNSSLNSSQILKGLKQEAVSTTHKKIDENLSIHMFLEDLRFLTKHQREKLL